MAYRMGSFISGVPSWASMAPSRNSTSEWTMLWRWITASTCSTGRSYSRMASMISSPLFIRVAESMVIFAPMAGAGQQQPPHLAAVAAAL